MIEWLIIADLLGILALAIAVIASCVAIRK